MNTQSTSPSNGPVTAQNAGTTDIPTLMAGAMRILAAFPPVIMELGMISDEAGEELALVDGPVCDAFPGVTPYDLDVTTSACPECTEELLAQWGNATWDIGKELGTIGGYCGDLVVEVMTYRIGEYEIGSRKPEVIFGDMLEGDPTCRDFTVNAMTMRLPQMALVDPCGGLADPVDGNPYIPVPVEQSFDDDPLRIMRVAHFSAQLGLDVDMDVMNAMEIMAPRLEIISVERICAELEHLIISPYLRRGIELTVYTGVAGIVLPEVVDLVSAVGEYKCHKDVYEYTLTVVEQTIDLETGPDGAVPAPGFILRSATLMHDVDRPATRCLESNGTVSFHHHEIVGTKMTHERMKVLCFDRVMVEVVSNLVALHLCFHGYGEAAWSDSTVYRYVADVGDLLECLHRLTRVDCTTRSRRKANYLSAAYDDLEMHIAVLREQEELDVIRLDLDGDQIMEILELCPSRVVKIARDCLLELCMERGSLDEEATHQVLFNWWVSDDVRALAEECQAQQAHWEVKAVEKKARKVAAKAAREAQGQ